MDENLEEMQEVGNESFEDVDYESSVDESWITWYCRQEGNEFMIEVDEDFIKNKVNLFGLNKNFPNLE
jgi:hypothetical protein